MWQTYKCPTLFKAQYRAAIGWVYSCGKLSITDDGIWATDKTPGSWLHIKLGPRCAVSTVCQDQPSQKHLHTFEYKSAAATIENWRKSLQKLPSAAQQRWWWGLRVGKFATAVVYSLVPSLELWGCNCSPAFWQNPTSRASHIYLIFVTDVRCNFFLI